MSNYDLENGDITHTGPRNDDEYLRSSRTNSARLDEAIEEVYGSETKHVLQDCRDQISDTSASLGDLRSAVVAVLDFLLEGA